MTTSFRTLFKNTKINFSQDRSNVELQIITPRLIIRSVKEEDISFYQGLWTDTDVMATFAEGAPRIYSGSDVEKAVKAQNKDEPDYASWRIRDWENSWLKKLAKGNVWCGLTILTKDDNKIGHIILGGGELAYFIKKEEWGKGYASEATIALINIALPFLALNHCDVIDIPKEINATARIDNTASQKVLQKAGFVINNTTETSEKFGFTRYEPKLDTEILIQKYQAEVNSTFFIDCLIKVSIVSAALILIGLVGSVPPIAIAGTFTLAGCGLAFFQQSREAENNLSIMEMISPSMV